MKLEEFLAKQRWALACFEDWWRGCVVEYGGPDSGDADMFPEEMEPDEWDDQFVTFQEEFLQETGPKEAPSSPDSSGKILRFRRD